MGTENQTGVTEVVLLGFTDNMTINFLLFFLFFFVFVLTILGNIILNCAILVNPHLHTPMYFFLSLLSIMDLGNILCSVPKLLIDLLSTQRTISLMACSVQLVLLLWIGSNASWLLTVMAIDRYVAICHPLHYSVAMRWSVCHRLSIFGFLITFSYVCLPPFILPITLCSANKINHFMCEAAPLLKISCGDNHDIEIIMFFFSFVTLFFPFVIIALSYTFIIYSVFKVHSATRSKAFYTCSSHIMVVVVCYGSGMITFLGPSSESSSNKQKYFSISYVIMTSLLNPYIYSLNNRDVKETIGKMLHFI